MTDNKESVRVLSLFDGMACGMLAMQMAGIEVERYVAFEYDEESANAAKGRPYGYAALTASHNFPMIEQRGDVFTADFTEFAGFDFLVGGSPCTYWSIAQKNNRETEASGMGWELFSQYVRALHEAKPKFFVYENNKSMSKAIRESIDKAFGFEAIGINSALVSAQNRQRLYWVGKRNEDGTYSKVPIEQPEDLGVLLKDVLECGHALKEKNGTIDVNYYKGGNYSSPNKQSGQGMTVAEPVRVGTWPNNAKNQAHDSQQYRIYSTEGKGVTLCGNGGGMGAKTGLYAVPGGMAWRGRGESSAFEMRGDQKSNTVSATGHQSRMVIEAADGKTYPVYEVKDGQITIKGKQYPIKLKDGFYIIRKLTVRECMHLQTVPEWYEFPVSDAQAYKMLGNGWTCRVIEHLIRGCMATLSQPLTEKEPKRVLVKRIHRSQKNNEMAEQWGSAL